MSEREHDMLALALGQMFLTYEHMLDRESLTERVKSTAEKCLLEIVEILDREELDDFQCVEEIVTCIEKIGLGTFRHDFG